MTETLELIFHDVANKQSKFTINNVLQDVSEAVARDAMQKLLSLDILRLSNNVPTKIGSAQIVSKTTRNIFTDK
ncbi:DUF2922 domain-containing protein [Staphylococcus pettenkoferi]|uniref:DUF2922 domain-containing protein n=1 Tax=Staphylococcus pettenkoferi TaxID=170573 RepID=UPI0011A65018|nr:DUF2922 domain-containing protein [Staphylococcus pettenkoferi]